MEKIKIIISYYIISMQITEMSMIPILEDCRTDFTDGQFDKKK